MVNVRGKIIKDLTTAHMGSPDQVSVSGMRIQLVKEVSSRRQSLNWDAQDE